MPCPYAYFRQVNSNSNYPVFTAVISSKATSSPAHVFNALDDNVDSKHDVIPVHLASARHNAHVSIITMYSGISMVTKEEVCDLLRL